MVKNVMLFLLLGAACGNALATLVAPGMLSWYNTPGDNMGATQQICNVGMIVKQTSSSLIRAQLIGSLIGAVVFVVAGLVISRMRNPKPPVAAPPLAPPVAGP